MKDKDQCELGKFVSILVTLLISVPSCHKVFISHLLMMTNNAYNVLQ